MESFEHIANRGYTPKASMEQTEVIPPKARERAREQATGAKGKLRKELVYNTSTKTES